MYISNRHISNPLNPLSAWSNTSMEHGLSSSDDKWIHSSLDSFASACTVTWKMELTTWELDTLRQPFIDRKLLSAGALHSAINIQSSQDFITVKKMLSQGKWKWLIESDHSHRLATGKHGNHTIFHTWQQRLFSNILLLISSLSPL